MAPPQTIKLLSSGNLKTESYMYGLVSVSSDIGKSGVNCILKGSLKVQLAISDLHFKVFECVFLMSSTLVIKLGRLKAKWSIDWQNIKAILLSYRYFCKNFAKYFFRLCAFPIEFFV